jgi:hypothetical protein
MPSVQSIRSVFGSIRSRRCHGRGGAVVPQPQIVRFEGRFEVCSKKMEIHGLPGETVIEK